MGKLIVIAIGGNSLIKDPRHVTVHNQFEACAETCSHIAPLVKAGHQIVITHGNGPQVGFILRRSELARHELHMVPLDSCVADTQGAIGFHIQMAMQSEMRKKNYAANIATIVTQVLVDRDDPSFKNPTKPIGSFMSNEEALHHEREEGWHVIEDSGRGWRRVVPSPKPIEIIELEAIKALLERNMIVVAVGGGGIPVYRDEDGDLVGLEAVIDKDLASSLLARRLNADLFVISTAVNKVSLHYRKESEKALDKVTAGEAKKYITEGHFAAGSMLPKIKSMIDFIEATGNTGIITDPLGLSQLFDKNTGTLFIR